MLMRRSLLLIVAIFAFSSPCFADKILDYGFEDWEGYDGNNSPADGYIYSHPDTTVWGNHMNASIVTSGGANCGGNTAYSGTYYQHIQFSGSHDTCLGSGGAVNSNNNFGYNGTYPSGTKDTTHFGTLLTGDEVWLRFRFRVTNDWTSAQTTIDNGGGLKFIRWGIGNDYHDDDSAILVKLLNDGDDTYPQFGIYDNGVANTAYYTPSVNWQDGNWHSFALYVNRTATETYVVSIYLDDWDMESTALATRSTTVSDEGNGSYYFAAFAGNWSAQTPTNLMGMDFDDIEVWNSAPSSGGSSSLTSNGPGATNMTVSGGGLGFSQ